MGRRHWIHSQPVRLLEAGAFIVVGIVEIYPAYAARPDWGWFAIWTRLAFGHTGASLQSDLDFFCGEWLVLNRAIEEVFICELNR